MATVAREIEQFLDVFCKDQLTPIHKPTDEVNGTNGVDAQSSTAARNLVVGVGSDLEVRVRQWYQSLVPSDLHGRLISIVGQDYWHKQFAVIAPPGNTRFRN